MPFPALKRLFQWLFIFSLTYITWQLLNPSPQIGIDISDKLVHFLIFGWLALTLDWGWYKRGTYWLFKALPLIAYGALIEIFQFFIPGRSMSVGDWLADSLGVVVYPIGLLLLLKILNRFDYA